jgi:hypothetical protein
MKKRIRRRRIGVTRLDRSCDPVVVLSLRSSGGKFSLQMETETGQRSIARSVDFSDCFERLEARLRNLAKLPEAWIEDDIQAAVRLAGRIPEWRA